MPGFHAVQVGAVTMPVVSRKAGYALRTSRAFEKGFLESARRNRCDGFCHCRCPSPASHFHAKCAATCATRFRSGPVHKQRVLPRSSVPRVVCHTPAFNCRTSPDMTQLADSAQVSSLLNKRAMGNTGNHYPLFCYRQNINCFYGCPSAQ